jgi:hypothetical protein
MNPMSPVSRRPPGNAVAVSSGRFPVAGNDHRAFDDDLARHAGRHLGAVVVEDPDDRTGHRQAYRDRARLTVDRSIKIARNRDAACRCLSQPVAVVDVVAEALAEGFHDGGRERGATAE